ncbi:hypothetical protein [Synechococcus sp. Nb3U1]|uniref:hypothetical protein n=1 Tax=Synechococcus sp. Nb3U1 TaxID=1914529 RepID=UPI001F40F8FA|nr:hypothetical protein [Synechococcus sp. Nb3U1]
MDYYRMFYPVGGAGLFLVVFGGILFGIFRALNLQIGELADWAIGIASFWWLVVILTIPWNIYFQAKAVHHEAEVSRQRGIPVETEAFNYTGKLTYWFLRIAIALHLVSAMVFYGLAFWQVTPIGYASSVAALLLTALRPALRGYEYLVARLTQLQRQILVPREDAIELAFQVRTLTQQVGAIQSQLDPHHPNSWAQREEETRRYLRQELATTKAQVEQLRASNDLEHEQLRRETQQSVAQLSIDSQFLSHVREILRFVKEA